MNLHDCDHEYREVFEHQAVCAVDAKMLQPMLSKAEFEAAGQMAGGPVKLQRVTGTLLKWIKKPVLTRLLGLAILNELEEAGTEVLVREPGDKVEIVSLQWMK